MPDPAQETVEERAKRLGLAPDETVEQRAQRLGLSLVPRAPAAQADVSRALSRSRPNASGDFQAATAPGMGKALADDIGPAVAAHLLNIGQAVPFARNAEAVAGLIGSQFTKQPMGYRESLSALDAMTSEIPPEMRAGEQIAAVGPGILSGLAKAGRVASVIPWKKVGQAYAPKTTKAIGLIRDAVKAAGTPVEDVVEGAGRVVDPLEGASEAAGSLSDAAKQRLIDMGVPPEKLGLASVRPSVTPSLSEIASPVSESGGEPAADAIVRHATRARMNADAERMGLPLGPPPPQGALRAPDAVDDGGDLLDLLARSVEMAKAKRVP